MPGVTSLIAQLWRAGRKSRVVGWGCRKWPFPSWSWARLTQTATGRHQQQNGQYLLSGAVARMPLGDGLHPCLQVTWACTCSMWSLWFSAPGSTDGSAGDPWSTPCRVLQVSV